MVVVYRSPLRAGQNEISESRDCPAGKLANKKNCVPRRSFRSALTGFPCRPPFCRRPQNLQSTESTGIGFPQISQSFAFKLRGS